MESSLQKKLQDILKSKTDATKTLLTSQELLQIVNEAQKADKESRLKANLRTPIYKLSKTIILTNIFPFLEINEILKLTEVSMLFNIIIKSPLFTKLFTKLCADTTLMLAFDTRNTPRDTELMKIETHKIRMLKDMRNYHEDCYKNQQAKSQMLNLTSKSLDALHKSFIQEKEQKTHLIQNKIDELKELKQQYQEEESNWEEEEKILRAKIKSKKEESAQLIFTEQLKEYNKAKAEYTRYYYENAISKIHYEKSKNVFLELRKMMKQPIYNKIQKLAGKSKAG